MKSIKTAPILITAVLLSITVLAYIKTDAAPAGNHPSAKSSIYDIAGIYEQGKLEKIQRHWTAMTE